MKILSNRSVSTPTGTGFTINGECVMLNKYGDIYPCIDNVMHPNPGTEEDEYSEIERTIDWLYRHDMRRVKPLLRQWIHCRVANEFVCNPNISNDECILNVLYSDLYEPCTAVKVEIQEVLDDYRKDAQLAEDASHEDELSISRNIVSFLNENFLRVRAGGKLNPEGSNSIYFRISSHGYDWNRVIVDFLWDVFGDPKNMPKSIWIGHDEETNPPEVILFNGTPSDLFEKYDDKVFASYRALKQSVLSNKLADVNKDRLCYRMNKFLVQSMKSHNKEYISFR